jgi:hypothetical protein
MLSLRQPAIFSLFLTAAFIRPFGHSYSTAQRSDVLHFDAQWWHHASSDEQQGFIYGYRDCVQPAGAPMVSIVDEQTFVSKTVDSQKVDRPNAVLAAIHLGWKTMKSQETPKNSEVFAGPHGFLDGAWWGGFSGDWPSDVTNADRGYLEGYLECSFPPVTARSVRLYQEAINKHYAAGLHERDKIANVLEGLLKRPAVPQK